MESGGKADPTVRLRINGRDIQARAGARLLDVLDLHGIHVPRLCYDPRLTPSSACRICEIQVTGQGRPVCACSTVVDREMAIETHTPELEHFRAEVLTFLARQYPREALEGFEEKPFHQYLRQYKVEPPTECPERERLVDRTHPYIAIDMHRCIECYRCVHICNDVQGQFVWKILNRGPDTQVLPDSGTTLLASSCVSCGACVDTCPTGALEDQSRTEKGAAVSWTRTTCPYCGTGCEMNVGVKDDRIVGIKPVLDAPVSKGHLCVKGRYATDFVDASDRVTEPMLKRDGKWVVVSWEEALSAAAEGLRRIQKEHGPDAIGVLGSARATNEEGYVVQKFSRVVLGTNNVDCCARVCHAPSAAGLGAVFGTGAATNSFDDIERAHAFMIMGCNPTENHPIVGARIKQRVLRGIPLIVVDPRKTELTSLAKVHLAIRPGTNLPLLHAMARVLIEEGLADTAFTETRTEGFSDFATSIKDWSPEAAGAICGVNPEAIRQAARIYASAKPAMCFHGLGVTEQIQGTDGVIALAHLAMLTGNVGIPGGGINPLRGQNNVQGTAVMGCEPGNLTGSQKIPVAKDAHERVWNAPIPKSHGLNLMKMIDAAAEGKLKGMLIFGYDVYLTNPDAQATAQALGQLEEVIVVDLFMTKTAEAFGTVFLPAASSFEKAGTFMNAERRIQRVRPAVSVRGNAKTDLEIVSLLAERMGFKDAFSFRNVSEVWDEVRSLWPAVKGMSYDRLERGGLLWPCPTEDHPGTEVLHQKEFKIGPRAKFRTIAYRPSTEAPSEEFPFVLNTGRSLYHFNAATMTGRSRNQELLPDDLISIHAQDAARLGIQDGVRIRLESKHGSFSGVARITEAVAPGQLFATFHHIDAMVNRVTGQGRDPVTSTPEFKVTAVKVCLEV